MEDPAITPDLAMVQYYREARSFAVSYNNPDGEVQYEFVEFDDALEVDRLDGRIADALAWISMHQNAGETVDVDRCRAITNVSPVVLKRMFKVFPQIFTPVNDRWHRLARTVNIAHTRPGTVSDKSTRISRRQTDFRGIITGETVLPNEVCLPKVTNYQTIAYHINAQRYVLNLAPEAPDHINAVRAAYVFEVLRALKQAPLSSLTEIVANSVTAEERAKYFPATKRELYVAQALGVLKGLWFLNNEGETEEVITLRDREVSKSAKPESIAVLNPHAHIEIFCFESGLRELGGEFEGPMYSPDDALPHLLPDPDEMDSEYMRLQIQAADLGNDIAVVAALLQSQDVPRNHETAIKLLDVSTSLAALAALKMLLRESGIELTKGDVSEMRKIAANILGPEKYSIALLDRTMRGNLVVKTKSSFNRVRLSSGHLMNASSEVENPFRVIL